MREGGSARGRGFRVTSTQMVGMNRKLDDSIETVFLMAEAEHQANCVEARQGDRAPWGRQCRNSSARRWRLFWRRNTAEAGARDAPLGLYLLYALVAPLMVAFGDLIRSSRTPPGSTGSRVLRWSGTTGGAAGAARGRGARRAAPVVLYFMGNAGSLAAFEPILARQRLGGAPVVVAMTFRGGGGMDGRPSEAGLKSDALMAHDAAAGRIAGGTVRWWSRANSLGHRAGAACGGTAGGGRGDSSRLPTGGSAGS